MDAGGRCASRGAAGVAGERGIWNRLFAILRLLKSDLRERKRKIRVSLVHSFVLIHEFLVLFGGVFMLSVRLGIFLILVVCSRPVVVDHLTAYLERPWSVRGGA